jgi:hypothetical protein
VGHSATARSDHELDPCPIPMLTLLTLQKNSLILSDRRRNGSAMDASRKAAERIIQLAELHIAQQERRI